jgi:PAS domain S-box-containing protein
MADAPLDTGTTSPARRRRPLLITFAVFVAIVGVVVGVTYAVYRQQLRTIRNRTADQLVSIGGLKAGQISAWLQERRGDANTLRANEPIERLIAQWLAGRGGPLPADVRRYFAALIVQYQYASIAVFDRYGRQRWPAATAATGDVGQYVVEAVGGALVWRRTVFVDLHKSANGLPTLGYVVPIDVAHRGPPVPVGAVYLRVDPARFLYPLVQTWPVPSGTAETLLVRRDGDMVTFLNPVRGFSGAPLTLAIPVTDRQLPATKAVNGATGVVEGVDYRGAKVLADLRAVSGTRSPFGDTQWYMIAKVDSREVYAGAFRRAAAAIGVMAAVIAVAGLGVLLFWRSRESRSLQALNAAERERRALGQHYECVTRYANDSMLLFAVDGAEMRVVDANERAVQTYGYSLEELRALTLRDLRSETSPTSYEAALDLLHVQGAAVIESEHRRRDGSVFPVENSARLMEIEGRPYLQCIVRDISERKAAEEALGKLEAVRDVAEEVAGIGNWTWDLATQKAVWSPGMFRLWDVDPDEFDGDAMAILTQRVHPDDLPALLETTALVLETSDPLPVEFRLVLRDGTERIVASKATPRRDADGSVVAITGYYQDVTERRQAEQELRREHAFAAAVMDTAGALICVLDRQGRITAFNRACEETTGYSFAEVSGEPIWERLIPPADVDGVKAVFADLTAGVMPSHYVNNWIAKDGPQHMIEWSNTIIVAADGDVEHVIGTGIDVTERRAAEERVSRLSRLYRVLSAVDEAIVHVREPQPLYAEICRILVEMGEFSMVWVGLVDDSRRVIAVAMAGHTGDYLDDIEITVDRRRTARGPAGRAIITGTTQVSADIATDPAMKPWREAALRHGFRSLAALPLRCGNEVIGAIMINSDSVSALDEEGVALLTQLTDDVSFAIESHRGETERRAAEQSLRESERMLAEAQRLGHVGSWRFDVPSGTLMWSPELYRIFGLEPGTFVPTLDAFTEHVHPDDRSAIAKIGEARAQGRPDEAHEIRVIRSDGEIRHISTRVANIYGDDGAPLEMVGTTIDVTERKVMEDELRSLNAELEQRVGQRTAQLEVANEELEAFAYSVSHDLRAPLRALDGFSLALLEDYTDGLDATAQDYLGRVRAASQRMGVLIDDLLGLSRVTRREMVLEDVDLSAVARRIVERFQQEQPERSVEFAIADGLRAQADPGLLEIVLDNLVGNAWKFTSKRKSAHIEFAVDGEGGEDVYHVRDDGAGFDPTYAGKLFAPFQRLHSMSEFPGTGIGLATVQRIVHRHGGRCWAEGAPGIGATVYFTLAPAEGQERSGLP